MINYLRMGNVIISGRSGSGKTEWIYRYLDEFLKETNNQVLIFDPKTYEFIDYVDNKLCKVISDGKEFYQELLSIIERKDVNKQYLIVIDELADLYINISKVKYKRLLEDISINSHNYNIRYIFASQLKSLFSMQLRNNCNTYMILNSHIN